MKADSTIKRELSSLREDAIERTDDRVLMRVAQAVEFGIRWARHDVKGWNSPTQEATELAKLIRHEQMLHD